MGNYYFLASLLPDLQIGHIPYIGYYEFKEMLRENLSKEDLRKVELLLRIIDIENMQSIWAGEPIDPRGNYDEEHLKKAIEEQAWPTGEEFEAVLTHYLSEYHTDQERLAHFPDLMTRFLNEHIDEEGFLGRYFNFEREFRLVIMGFRAKLLHRDVSAELQYENTQDPIVAQILAQKDASTYDPPFGYEDLKPIFEAYRAFPLELHKFLNEYKFQRIEEMNENKLFSIDRILSYLEQLILVERWLELDAQQGLKVVDAIVRETQ